MSMGKSATILWQINSLTVTLVEMSANPKMYQRLNFSHLPHLRFEERQKMSLFFESYRIPLGKRLAAQWGHEVKVKVMPIQELSASKIIHSFPQSSAFMSFRHQMNDAPGILIIDPHSLSYILGRMIGSSEKELSLTKNLTDFEKALLKKFSAIVLDTLSESLKDFPKFSTDSLDSAVLAKTKWKHQFSSKVSFELHFGQVPCSFSLLFSLPLGKSIASLLPKWEEKNIECPCLENIKISLDVLLGKQMLSRNEIDQLQTEDILLLGATANTPVAARSFGKEIFLGSIGTKGAHKGIQIDWISSHSGGKI